MATVYQGEELRRSHSLTRIEARSVLRQFGLFPITRWETTDREGAPLEVATVMDPEEPRVVLIIEDV
ncbi:hypothetical protein ACFPA8_07750 [Streptomyces ovatisporus]|uniref:Uncharacterized protein n=1 Tax=Streptomyces ovatisporus TaxID=1128682 RepID=A0ABV9A268_9ACTN